MSGGGGSTQSYVPPAPAPVYREVNAPEIPTTGYGGMGYYSVPNPFLQGSKPAWMQGYFDMPSWGMDAVTGQPLTQEQLQVQQPPPPPAPAPEQAPAPAPAPQQAPFDMRGMYDAFSRQQAWDRNRDEMFLQDGSGGSNGVWGSYYRNARDPLSRWEDQQRRMQNSGLAEQMQQRPARPGLLELLQAQGLVS
jgi:hypothetical protein